MDARRHMHLAFAALFLCGAGPTDAAAAEKVEVRGVRIFAPERVIQLMQQTGARPGTREWLRPAQEAYYAEGYLGATFAVSQSPGDGTWIVSVEEGRRARMGRIRVHGVDEAETLRASLGLEANGPFRPRELSRKIDSLLRRYDDNGFPYAQVRIDSIGYDPGSQTVDLVIYVLDGRRRTIRNVRVEGLGKTRPELAARITGIEPGSVYSAQALEDAFVRLRASGLFNRVEGPDIRAASEGFGVDAVFVVDEPERSHVFTAAAGYAAAEGKEDRELSGMVHLQLINLGGALKDFDLFWANDGRERNETRIEYRDRFLLGRRLGLGLRLEQIGQDTLYTWQSGGFDLSRPVRWIGGGASAIVAGAHVDRNVFGTGDLLRSLRTRLRLGVTLVRGSQRQSTLINVALRSTYARKRNVARGSEARSNVEQYILEAEMDARRLLSRNAGARVRLRYNGLESSERIVPVSELFDVGGARSLRGYKENQFRGRRVATARNELFLGPSWRENGYVFADVGYLLSETAGVDGSTLREERFLSGYGFGLRTISPAGMIDLSFALDEQLSLRQTKVHVILEQNF